MMLSVYSLGPVSGVKPLKRQVVEHYHGCKSIIEHKSTVEREYRTIYHYTVKKKGCNNKYRNDKNDRNSRRLNRRNRH